MASANLFQQYLQPVRSVADYSSDMDRRELLSMQMEGQQRQNVIAGIDMQGRVAEMRETRRQQEARRGMPYTNPEQWVRDLRGKGLHADADKFEKSQLENKAKAVGMDKDRATIVKQALEAQTQLATFPMANPTREAAAAALSRMEAVYKQLGIPVDFTADAQAIAGYQSPDQIKQHFAGMALQAKELLPKLQVVNAETHQVNQAVNTLTGAVTETGRTAIGQSENNKATTAASIENNRRTVGASYANAAATRDAARESASAVRDAARVQRDQATEMKLADDYRAQSKGFQEADSAYKTIQATLDSATKSPAATLAAATKFMKVLDPGSVVRESELGMALAASGVVDRAMNYMNVLQSGRVLTANQVKDFKKISADIHRAAQQVQQNIDKDYQSKAKTYGLRPEMVTQDLGQNATSGGGLDMSAIDAEIARRRGVK